MKLSLEEERLLGMFCEEGLVQEKYDASKDELVKSLTPLGVEEVRKMLKDPLYRKKYMEMIKEEIQNLPEPIRLQFLKNCLGIFVK